MTRKIRCAIYTRKSTEEGLDKEFNTLEAQREACAAYIASQRHEHWMALPEAYDDGGYSGGSMERPALKQLIREIKARRVDVIVIYKIDRLTRSLTDFARLADLFDEYGVSFVSVTQQFNTTTSMGRLMLNVLLSFAQFEREIAGERIRDKIAASKRKGLWMGGTVPLGYDAIGKKLVINQEEAQVVREIFGIYLQTGSGTASLQEAKRRGLRTKERQLADGRIAGGKLFSRGPLYHLLQNPAYIGKVGHQGKIYNGQHQAIIPQETWHKVQDQLKQNRLKHRRRSNAKIPSLLAGILTDEAGSRFTPSHSNKNGLRHRYYIERKTETGSGTPPDHKPHRIPALEIENAICDRLITLLTSHEEVLATIRDIPSPRDLEAALASAGQWAETIHHAAPVQRAAELIPLLEHVILGEHMLRIRIRLDVLHARMGLAPCEAVRIHDLTCPFTWVRRGVQMKMVIGETRGQIIKDDTLIQTIARAQGWGQRLMAGESIAAMAEAEECDRSYITRTLRLAFLAPDIIEAILDGRQPDDLRSKRLSLDKNLPLDWEEQRLYLGFPQR